MIYNKKLICLIFFSLVICLFPKSSLCQTEASNFTFIDSDNNDSTGSDFASLFYFFDLREKETFIQVTYPDKFSTGFNGVAHIQIFDVSNNCNENDFFDIYTPFDTHVYNMRDIKTNDGNPSGVILPDGAYGIVVVALFITNGRSTPGNAIGNMRIIDKNGYEYRTNAPAIFRTDININSDVLSFYSFNFSHEAGITYSDVVGITLSLELNTNIPVPGIPFEWNASNPISAFQSFDIDIVNNNETIFSCRDVIFSCVDEENPKLQELLEFAGTANVASFEYGINNTIPHSKSGELLCPGNTISEGVVTLRPEIQPRGEFPFFIGFIGLNDGNSRGSMDAIFYIDPLFN